MREGLGGGGYLSLVAYDLQGSSTLEGVLPPAWVLQLLHNTRRNALEESRLLAGCLLVTMGGSISFVGWLEAQNDSKMNDDLRLSDAVGALRSELDQ